MDKELLRSSVTNHSSFLTVCMKAPWAFLTICDLFKTNDAQKWPSNVQATFQKRISSIILQILDFIRKSLKFVIYRAFYLLNDSFFYFIFNFTKHHTVVSYMSTKHFSNVRKILFFIPIWNRIKSNNSSSSSSFCYFVEVKSKKKT